MRNIAVLFLDDVKRIVGNTCTRIILVGLIVLPSLFAWYNTTACWDVFDNTDKLKVAVASVDEGYKGDILPFSFNIGDEVVSALRENDDIAWVITDEEDAIDGTMSGEYYAAVVIPTSFSEDMLTFFSDNVEHAPIVYYSNEKVNAIAPKIIDQGATAVSYQVNQTFSETLMSVILNIAAEALNYLDTDSVQEWAGDLTESITAAGEGLMVTADVMEAYVPLLSATQTLTDSSVELIAQTSEEVQNIRAALSGTREAVTALLPALEEATDVLVKTLDDTMATYEETAAAVDKAFADVDTLSTDTVSDLRAAATRAQTSADALQNVIEALQSAADKTLLSAVKDTLEQAITNLQAQLSLQQQLIDNLTAAADNIESANATAQSLHANTSVLAQTTYETITKVSAEYNTRLKPALQALTAKLSEALTNIDAVLDAFSEVTVDVKAATDNLQTQLTTAGENIAAAAERVRVAAAGLNELGTAFASALDGGSTEEIRALIGDDPEAFAALLSAPVSVERHALYASSSFGSAMSPLYSSLALWVGTLLMLVTIKTKVEEKSLEKLRRPRDFELFLGRFLVFSAIATLQALLLAAGNMLFLGVDCANPGLYLFCYWLSGQAFLFINYTLTATFGNVGKAIAVILLIFQVSAGGGSFPLVLLPDFVQNLSPFMPITHCVNAMRAAMFGVFQNDFWIELGTVGAMGLPFLLVGLLRRPFVKANTVFSEKTAKSQLM